MRAMILAAGMGTRMRPYTNDTPKPLLPVAGKPMIVHLIEQLAEAGFRELVINTHYLAEQFPQQLGDGSRWGVNIAYSHESELLETGGGIQHALPQLGDKPFLVVSGDTWQSYDFRALFDSDLGEKLMHLVLSPQPGNLARPDFYLRSQPSAGTNLYTSRDLVLYQDWADEQENGSSEATPAHWQALNWARVAVFSPMLWQAKVPAKPHALMPLFKRAMLTDSLSAEIWHGSWLDVGTPKELRTLREQQPHS